MTDAYSLPAWSDFVAAVRADPASDLVRLTAADWLDDNGEGLRARYIRLECAFAAGRKPGDVNYCRKGCRCQPCRAGRAGDAIYSGPEGWRRWFPWAESESDPVRWNLRRGFMEQLWAPADWWVRNGDALLAREPVREVTLIGGDLTARYGTWRQPDGSEAIGFGFQGDESGRVVMPESFPREKSDIETLAELRWPGVTFRLPPPPTAGAIRFDADGNPNAIWNGGRWFTGPATTRGLFTDRLGDVRVTAGPGGVGFSLADEGEGDHD